MNRCKVCGCEGWHGCLGFVHWWDCPAEDGGECLCLLKEREAARAMNDHGATLTELAKQAHNACAKRREELQARQNEKAPTAG